MARKTNKYKVTIELTSGDKREYYGKTLTEAFDKIDLDYTGIKTKGTVSLEHEGKTSHRLLYLRDLRLLVVNKFRKYALGRNLEYLLK